MTGAPLPPGADAVVMVEDTEVTEDGRRVRIARPAGLGDAVRRAGDDVHKGDLLFPAGTELRPAVVGVLASVGSASVRVVSRPRVGVLSTGDELVEDGGPLGPGQIRESNRTDAPRRGGPGRLRRRSTSASSATTKRPWKPSWPRPRSGATPW